MNIKIHKYFVLQVINVTITIIFYNASVLLCRTHQLLFCDKANICMHIIPILLLL